jgi:adenylate cyclase
MEGKTDPEDKPATDAPEPPKLTDRWSRFREAAAKANANPALLRMVERLRRQLPGDEQFGDELSTAGKDPAQVVARRVSSLETTPDSTLTREVGMTALQLWQSLSEAQGRGRGEVDLAILFTDLVNFSSWALDAGDTVVVDFLRTVGSDVESAIPEHRGEIVKRLGDGLMAVFPHPQLAVEAALDAQERLARVEVPEYQPQMRAGVHLGRPRKVGSDYLGVDVNIAARVGAAAGPMEVLVSEAAAAELDPEQVSIGRSKTLRAPGAPDDLRVSKVKRLA